MVCKFVGCYYKILRDNQSGENTDDKLARAHQHFLETEGSKFTLDHCWRTLRHEPKWRSNYLVAPRPPPSPRSESGSKRSRDTTEDGEEQQSPIRPIGRDAAKRNRGKKIARKMADAFEDCSARESESRGSFEQMTALRIKQIELDMAKTTQKRDEKRMEVLMTLLNKQNLTPTEEETKERLLKLL